MTQRILTYLPALVGVLLGGLVIASCGVTEPDDSPWQNAGSFGWPTTPGVTMKYLTVVSTDTSEEGTSSTVTIDIGGLDDPYSPTYNGQAMYVLNDEDGTPTTNVHFFPMQDSLIIEQDEVGAKVALTTPIEKGNTWVASYQNGKAKWVAEIIELFAYRNVEGTTYEDVVAVRYTHPEDWTGGTNTGKEEWIRFYAKGVGEILTINNTFPESTLPNPIPSREKQRVLLETNGL